jgi:ligand-binding sensor protein
MKVLYEGKNGNVCEHQDYAFRVVDLDGKHVGYYTNFVFAKNIADQPRVKKEEKKEDPSKK